MGFRDPSNDWRNRIRVVAPRHGGLRGLSADHAGRVAMDRRKTLLDALAWPGSAWRGDRAGNSRRPNRSNVPAPRGFRGSRHAGATFLFHGRGDRLFYEPLVAR